MFSKNCIQTLQGVFEVVKLIIMLPFFLAKTGYKYTTRRTHNLKKSAKF